MSTDERERMMAAMGERPRTIVVEPTGLLAAIVVACIVLAPLAGLWLGFGWRNLMWVVHG